MPGEGDNVVQVRRGAGSIVPVPWASMKQAQVLMTMVDGDGSPLMLEPRNVLAHVVKKLDELGLKATVACEFEFYLLDKDMDRKGRPQPPINPATGARETAHEVYGITELDGFMGLLKEIDEAAAEQGVPASGAGGVNRTPHVSLFFSPGIWFYALCVPFCSVNFCSL